MKTILFLAAVAFAGWYYIGKLQKSEPVQQAQQKAVDYAKDLQRDAEKAQRVAEQANAAIEQSVKGVQKVVEEAKK